MPRRRRRSSFGAKCEICMFTNLTDLNDKLTKIKGIFISALEDKLSDGRILNAIH